MRSLSAVAVFWFAFLLAGCQESERSATGPEDTRVRVSSVPDNAAPEARINGRIRDLFPQPERSEAHKLFDQIKDAVDEGEFVLARDLVSDLIQLAASTDLKDPGGGETTAEAYSDLIDLLFEFVGLAPPGVSTELLEQAQHDDDGTVQVAVDGQDNLILTDSAFAGTFIPDEAISEDVVIVIERLTEDEQANLPNQECLPTDLQQREGCYQFDRFPEGDFDAVVEVGVCAESGTSEEFQLHKFEAEEADEGVVPLPSIAFPELDCGDFFIARSSSSPLPWRLAKAAWGATGGQLLGWIGPQPLKAIDIGFGGTTINFSRIGWARGVELSVSQSPGLAGSVNEPATPDPAVSVQAIHPSGTTATATGQPILFEVVQGGGTIGGEDTATVLSDVNGTADTSWTLGLEAGVRNVLRAIVPVDPSTVSRDTALFSVITNPVFSASFTNDSAGAVPGDPEVGTWLTIDESAGTIDVRDSIGDLVSRSVVFDQQAGLTGGLAMQGDPSVEPDAGTVTVSWQMLAQPGAEFGGIAVRDASSRLIAAVNLRSGGEITAAVSGQDGVDTGVDWSAGQAQWFELTIDLDARTVDLAIDFSSTQIIGADFRESAASSVVSRLDMSTGGTSAQVYAFDNLQMRIE